MFSANQIITFISIIVSLSQARRLVDPHLDVSEIEQLHHNVNKRSESPQGGLVHIMVRCPDGRISKEILSTYLPNTSVEAIAPKMEYWNDLTQEARDEMQCNNGDKAQMRLEGLSYLHHKRKEIPQPGFVKVIAACADGSNSKTVFSQYVEDTSIEAVSPMFPQWNDLAQQARKELRCANGKTAAIRIQVT